jgi:general secretion pathway protein D
LFRNSHISRVKGNLMIFLTPHIIHGANDLAVVYERKVRERDEYLRLIYGASYKEKPIYKRLATLESGRFVEDNFDRIDNRNRQQRIDDMLRDAGYNLEEVREGQSEI